MTPDEIKRFIQANYQNIAITVRNNPDGWSFWYGQVRVGQHSTRIVRALDDGRGGTRFKLSVTSRLTDKNVVCSITSEGQLRELFEEELRLGLEHYDWSEQNCYLPGSFQLPGR